MSHWTIGQLLVTLQTHARLPIRITRACGRMPGKRGANHELEACARCSSYGHGHSQRNFGGIVTRGWPVGDCTVLEMLSRCRRAVLMASMFNGSHHHGL